MHRYPIPRPQELMESLGGGYGYTEIDLDDAYHQIELAPISHKRLALSTHRGVLLQQRLLFLDQVLSRILPGNNGEVDQRSIRSCGVSR